MLINIIFPNGSISLCFSVPKRSCLCYKKVIKESNDKQTVSVNDITFEIHIKWHMQDNPMVLYLHNTIISWQ